MTKVGQSCNLQDRTLEAPVLPDSRVVPEILYPRRILRVVYIGRLALASAILIAAVVAWVTAPGASPSVPIYVFGATLAFTVTSFFLTEVRAFPVTQTFTYVQVLFDLALVTVVIHLTWYASHSQFAPLFILVIVSAAMLLPLGRAMLVAALADVLYLAETIWGHPTVLGPAVWLQLGVFAIVALGSGYICAKLREAGAGKAEIAAELALFKLKQGDVDSLRVRAERLEAVAALSASLAHEIKNPLASIRSAAEQLAKIPRAGEDEKTLTALVQKETDRLSRLLSEFLDFARPSVTRVETVNVGDVIRHASAVARAQTADGITVKYVLPRRELLVNGDEDLLHRVFFNLILNGVQASPAGGEVRIEAGELAPGQIPSSSGITGPAIAIRVIDRGSGIPPDVRDRLFDPFVTTKPGGSGLGLSIVHRAVEAHRGFVLVDSEGGGSRFTVVLPRATGRENGNGGSDAS